MKKQEIIREAVSQNINDFSEICEKIEEGCSIFCEVREMFSQVYVELEMQIVSVYFTGDIDQKLQIFSVSIHFNTLSDK